MLTLEELQQRFNTLANQRQQTEQLHYRQTGAMEVLQSLIKDVQNDDSKEQENGGQEKLD